MLQGWMKIFWKFQQITMQWIALSTFQHDMLCVNAVSITNNFNLKKSLRPLQNLYNFSSNQLNSWNASSIFWYLLSLLPQFRNFSYLTTCRYFYWHDNFTILGNPCGLGVKEMFGIGKCYQNGIQNIVYVCMR